MREERGDPASRGPGANTGETDGGGGVPVARIRGGARSRAAEPQRHPGRRACGSAREGGSAASPSSGESPGHPRAPRRRRSTAERRQERLRRIASLRRGVHRAARRRAHRGRGMEQHERRHLARAAVARSALARRSPVPAHQRAPPPPPPPPPLSRRSIALVPAGITRSRKYVPAGLRPLSAPSMSALRAEKHAAAADARMESAMALHRPACRRL